jgi:hypothetical protein
MIHSKHFITLLMLAGAACTTGQERILPDGLHVYSDWGPYTFRYAGISHIADTGRGLCFDLSIFPVTPGNRNLPFENRYGKEAMKHRKLYTYWAASPKLEEYTYRFIIDPDRKAWCDVSYFIHDKASRLFQVDLHNKTGIEWAGDLHLLAHLRYPPKDYFARLGHEPLRLGVPDLPDGATWVNSLQYQKLTTSNPDKGDALPERGKLRREVRTHGSVGGSLLGRGFGQDEGDAVTYRFEVSREINDAILLLRGRSEGKQEASFLMSGAADGTCAFPVADEFRLVPVAAGRLRAGSHEVRLTSKGTGSVLFDGFIVVPEDLENKVRFTIQEPNVSPEIETIENGRGVILSYPDLRQVYGYAIAMPQAGRMRSLLWKELYPAFGEEEIGIVKSMVHGGGRYGKGDPMARFIDLGFEPDPLPDESNRSYWGMVCQGSKEEVHARLKAFLGRSTREYESRTSSSDVLPPYNKEGEPFALSQQLMSAATAMNIIYPQLHERRYGMGYTPAKSWGVVYTWDNGMHGIALNLLDTELSAALLYQMTTTPGAEIPFIWGGAPIPMQFYQFHEWWNRCRDREIMADLYPRLKQMYEWLIGRGHGSETRGPAKEGLISTYEYFHNSLGWDDYPGNAFASLSEKAGWPAPVSQSVHTLIGARTLAHAARELGLKKDEAVYQADALELERAILEDAWDGESGYSGYVVYDNDNGEALGILRGRRKRPSNKRPHEDTDNLEWYIGGTEGVNINMGLDGVAPWYAGIGSSEQREQQFYLLSTEGRLWTSIGLLTVDLESPFSCPGYSIDRVWNAPLWWFWKGALDQGKGEFAYNLAHAVLKNAMHTAEKTWSTYENFSFSKMEPGGTLHNYAGHAAPSLDFFHSYYVPGTISFGHDAWVEEQEWSKDGTEVRTLVRFEQDRSGETRLVLACFTPGGNITATWKGQKVPVERVNEGTVYVRLPCNKERGELIIRRKDY